MSLTSVSTPNAQYVKFFDQWQLSRAACEGERDIKDLDAIVSVGNVLIPFSPSMTQTQYLFYKAEAEWPGITAQFSKILVGGLLRKPPVVQIDDDKILDWIQNEFAQDGSSLITFLDEALLEEIKTSRTWIYVTYPENPQEKELKPYPVIWKAENVINWRVDETEQGNIILSQVIYKGYEEEYITNEFHPDMVEYCWVHELDENGYYQIRVFRENVLIDTLENIKIHGKRLDFIPAWPLNGSISILKPALTPIINKEISLYNKMSRRNHLLYGAATYTPIIKSDMSDEEFDNVVSSGLGTWIHLGKDEAADILKTPTEALDNMETTIQNTIEEIARLGVRMLSPENMQSGVALQLRNASQTAQLGSLNNRLSIVMQQIIEFMIRWRYNLEIPVEFSLTEDFNPTPIGEEWLRLATEWYEKGLIPRSTWISILKQNDMIDADYSDEDAQQEINADPFNLPKEDDYKLRAVK